MYREKVRGWSKHLDFIVLDMLCLQTAYMMAYAVCMGPSVPYSDVGYRGLGVVILLSGMAVSLIAGSFRGVLKRGRYEEFTAAVKHICLTGGTVAVYLFTVQSSAAYSRFVIYLMVVLYLCIAYFVRTLWKAWVLKRMAAAGEKRSLLIVTEEVMATEVIRNAREHGTEWFRVAGLAILDRDVRGREIQGIPVVASAEDLEDAVCRSWVDEALVILRREESYPAELVGRLAGMGVVVHTGLFRAGESGGMRQFVGRVGGYTVLTTSISYATPLQQFAKRTMDIIGGIVGCIFTGILFLLLAPAIVLASPGPVFFRQERVGRNGKKFHIYKFRSMYMDAEQRKRELMEKNRFGDSLMFKLEGDPRIIGCKVMPDGTVRKGLGNFMREHSLDEFPQFFNVLRGDMSLVGTRPPTVDEWERYSPHHRARLAMRPGITGLWQVSGRSSVTDFEEVVRLDTKYITEWSMGLDLRILLKTVKVVFGGDGAM